jgi:hypothetical protein
MITRPSLLETPTASVRVTRESWASVRRSSASAISILRSADSSASSGSNSASASTGPASASVAGNAFAGSGVEWRASVTARRARSSSASAPRSVVETNPTASPAMTRRPRPRVPLCFRLSTSPPRARTENPRVPSMHTSACSAPARFANSIARRAASSSADEAAITSGRALTRSSRRR